MKASGNQILRKEAALRRHESGGSARAVTQSKPLARIALLALLALVMAFAVACVQVPARAFAESATDQDPAASGEITRGEWLGNLVDLFEISVDEEDYPDNYFSDLSSDDEHYLSVLLAVSSGIVDIEPGGEVRANDAATREFVAQTLNYCLGFQLDEGVAYTFSDSADCAYPADDQVAVDKGWFALDNGAFNPKAHVTSEQAKTILDSAASLKKITQPSDDTVSTEYVFQDGVVVVPEETQVLVDGSTVTVVNAPETINAGSIFVVYLHGVACPYKADSVTTDGAATIIQTSEAAAEAAFKSVNIVGSFDADVTDFEPAEGVQATYLDLDTGEVIDPADNYVDPQSISIKNKAIVASLDHNFGGINGNITITTYNLKVHYKVDVFTGQYYIYVDGNQDLSVSVSGKKNFDENLGTIFIAGVGKISLDAHAKFNGSASYTEKHTFKTGAGYNLGDGFYLIKGFNKTGWSASIHAEADISVEVSISAGIPYLSARMYAIVGANAAYDMNLYSDGTPRKCETLAVYLYAKAGASTTFLSKTYSTSWVLWDWNNSPVRIREHAEDGVRVDCCTRGMDLNAFYTAASSRYSMIGAFGSSSSTGIGSDGVTPYTIFDYKLNDDGSAVITGYHGNAASIIIPETLDGYKVVGIGDKAFANNQTIRSLIIPDQITSIGEFAFFACKNLVSVVLPNGIESIPTGAFASCKSLSSIAIPESVTAIGYRAFEVCASLFSVDFPGSLVEIGANSFFACSSLASIEIPDSVTGIGGYAFMECDSLSSVRLSHNLEYLGDRAFADDSIEAIEIPASLKRYENGGYGGHLLGARCSRTYCLKTVALVSSATSSRSAPASSPSRSRRA